MLPSTQREFFFRLYFEWRKATKTVILAAPQTLLFRIIYAVYDVTLEGPRSELCRQGKRDWGRKHLNPNKAN